jgi:hypothetical protein
MDLDSLLNERNTILDMNFPKGKMTKKTRDYVHILDLGNYSVIKAKKNKFVLRKKFLSQYKFDF